MKQKNDYTLGEAMQAMLKEYRLGPQLNEMRIKSLWAAFIGISAALSPVRVE